MSKFDHTNTEFKQLLLSLIGNAPLGIIAIDFKGSISLINEKATQILDLSSDIDHYIDRNIQELLKTIPDFTKKIKVCITQGRTEFDLKHIAFHDKILTIRGRMILNGMLLTFEDMTEIVIAHQRLNERTHQLEINNKELEQFAYISSHDLQEPLLTITSFSKLILEKSDDSIPSDVLQFLQIINSAANRMSAQITGLLEYSRIGRNKEKTLTDCKEVIKSIQMSLLSQIENKNARFKIGKLPTIKLFKEEFGSLMQNLISNALKYKREDVDPLIEIKAKELDDYWQFSVKDNGIGIANEHKEKVFIIFQRLHNKDEYEGSGIGLAHCKKIVELHQGKIWFDSVPGKGTTFCFTIKK